MGTRSKIIQIGNSQGIRIAKPILEQAGITEDIEIQVARGQIIIRPIEHPRKQWEASFQRMTEAGDDMLEDALSESEWDSTEWTWE